MIKCYNYYTDRIMDSWTEKQIRPSFIIDVDLSVFLVLELNLVKIVKIYVSMFGAAYQQYRGH